VVEEKPIRSTKKIKSLVDICRMAIPSSFLLIYAGKLRQLVSPQQVFLFGWAGSHVAKVVKDVIFGDSVGPLNRPRLGAAVLVLNQQV
jgi:hypothetical protein